MEGDTFLGLPPQSLETTSTEKTLAKRPRVGETIIEGLLFLAGVVSILTTIGIVWVLARKALIFFNKNEVSISEF